KHIQRKYHFIQDDLVGKGEAVICYTSPTKPLVQEQHWKIVWGMELQMCLSGSDKAQ
ncbi:hypothetical protein PAXRUDRAFT_129581, partial [Paxillus rubicundulus Ve08.2h10]